MLTFGTNSAASTLNFNRLEFDIAFYSPDYKSKKL